LATTLTLVKNLLIIDFGSEYLCLAVAASTVILHISLAYPLKIHYI